MAAMSHGRGISPAAEAILSACARHPKGVKPSAVHQLQPDVSMEEITEGINELLKQHRLLILQNPDDPSEMLLQAVEVAEATKYKGLSPEEVMVYNHIQNSGNIGMWTKDMKQRTNLQQPQITKILKVLEARKLVKVVKSVTSANRKTYMDFNVEPSREITGGVWYTEQTMDTEFIEALRQCCIHVIRRKGSATVLTVAAAVRDKNIISTDVEMKNDDFGQVLDTLVLDGILERRMGPGDMTYSLASHELMPTTALTSMPCGICPVAADCTPDGAISPGTCQYYRQWLEHF